jgi:anti-anti-sigma factor
MPAYHYFGVRNNGAVVVVHLGKHRVLDIVTADQVGDDLYQLADQPDCRNLLLNFSGVTGLSSVMLGKLLVLRKKMEQKRGKLKLCDVGAEVDEVFAATKLHRLFDTGGNEAEALKTFA